MKSIITLSSIAAVLIVIVTLTGVYWMPIAGYLAQLFLDSPSASGGSAFTRFQGIENYPEEVKLYSSYEGSEAFLSFDGIAGLPTVFQESTSEEAALQMVEVAKKNLWLSRSWGNFLDIYANDTDVVLGNIKGNGTFATQVLKTQDDNSFFLNEGFALTEFQFLSDKDTTKLSNTLKTFVNGGCRILNDDTTKKKYKQWAIPATKENGGSIWVEETKSIETALKPVGETDIVEGVEGQEPYDKEKEFKLLLPLDMTQETIMDCKITYFQKNKYYVLDCNMDAEALTKSGSMAAVIQKLFGNDLTISNTVFSNTRFLITIWENGFIRSAECKIEWETDVKVSVFSLAVHSKNTSIDFFYTYDLDDCALASIKDKYYKDYFSGKTE